MDGYIVITIERHWIKVLLRFLHLLRFSWGRRLAYRRVKGKIMGFDDSTGTITVDKPFPGAVGAGDDYIYKRG